MRNPATTLNTVSVHISLSYMYVRVTRLRVLSPTSPTVWKVDSQASVTCSYYRNAAMTIGLQLLQVNEDKYLANYRCTSYRPITTVNV